MRMKLKARDHFFRWSWWSEPWAKEMVQEHGLVYDTHGSTLETVAPPTPVRVMIDGRDDGIARMFSSRKIRRVTPRDRDRSPLR